MPKLSEIAKYPLDRSSKDVKVREQVLLELLKFTAFGTKNRFAVFQTPLGSGLLETLEVKGGSPVVNVSFVYHGSRSRISFFVGYKDIAPLIKRVEESSGIRRDFDSFSNEVI